MNVCSDLQIPIYNVWIQVVLVDDIWDYYQATNTLGLKEEIDNYRAVTINSFNNPNKQHGYYMVFRTEDYSVGNIAHESLHIVANILDRIDTPLNKSTEEIYAYLLGYLVEQISEILIILQLRKNELIVS